MTRCEGAVTQFTLVATILEGGRFYHVFLFSPKGLAFRCRSSLFLISFGTISTKKT